MNRFIALILISILAASGFAASYGNASSGSGSGSGTTGNGIVVYQPNAISASNAIVGLANSAVIQRVGSSYFGADMKLTAARTYLYRNGTNVSVVAYSYLIPLSNGTYGHGIMQIGSLSHFLGVLVYIQKNTVTQYIGPSSNYFVFVPEKIAIINAKQYGLRNATTVYLTGVYSSSQQRNNGYQIVWAIRSSKQIALNQSCASTACGVYPGVYENISSGAIVGQFVVNPSILSTQGVTYGTLGNFSLYTQGMLTSTLAQLPQSQANIIVSNLVPRLILLFGAIVIVLFLVKRQWTARTKPKRKR